jgi:hypothetical protein
MKARGALLLNTANGLHDLGDSFLLEPGKSTVRGTREEWTHVFGFTTDNHLCNRHSRLDVLKAAYDHFEREGISIVYNAGNWIDGEARFNKTELVTAPGMDHQLGYLIDNWPVHEGIETHYIAGDDHEGWYQQREGIEVGRYLQMRAEDAGRHDLKYLGYGEADVRLQYGTGESVMRVVHPGGGSAYAISYTDQKRVECVPLDTEILTPSGWKMYEQLTIGDVVMGYNQNTDRCEWTKLLAINKYDDAEVVSYSNDSLEVRCTRDHKWAMTAEARGGANPLSRLPVRYQKTEPCLKTIDESRSNKRHRIVQAAEGPAGGGWCSNGDRQRMLNRETTVQAVLEMTSPQRQAFIFGMLAGEGTRYTSGGDNPTIRFAQRPGPVLDAFVLACFLEGIACSTTSLKEKIVKGKVKLCYNVGVLAKRHRMVLSMAEKDSTREPVWCPTTELGTWVMKQGAAVSITGNSYQGGEKPQIELVGHYHKFNYGYPREVHTLQGGCTTDQSMFMRKKRLQAHVGYSIVKIKQDEKGAVCGFAVEWHPFFDRGYYEKRFA